MSSRTSVSISAASCLALLVGCSGDGARIYAVTVTGADALICRVVSSGPYDDRTAESRISEQETAFEVLRMSYPAKPEGHTLDLVTTEDGVSAWFEEYVSVSTQGLGTEVLLGPSTDDFIDVTHVRTGYAFAADGAPVGDGPVPTNEVDLTATLVDGELAGRLLVTQWTYGTGDVDDANDTRIGCTESLPVLGAERR